MRKAKGELLSVQVEAALDHGEAEPVPAGLGQFVHSRFPSLCQDYVKKSLVERQLPLGSSVTPATAAPAHQLKNDEQPCKTKKMRLRPELNSVREDNPYLKEWLRHNYDPLQKPTRSTIGKSYLLTDGKLNIPSGCEITFHPTRLHKDYCAPKSVQWAEGVWKKVHFLSKLSIKVNGKWEWLSMDIRGPLPETRKGNRFLLIVMDLYTKWTEACPMRTSSAQEVALNLRNLMCQLGLPHAFFSQLSRIFIRAVNQALGIYMAMEDCSLMVFHPTACNLDYTTYYEANRVVRKLLREYPESWDVELNASLFAMRIKQHPKTGQSPFFALYQRDHRNKSAPIEPQQLPEELGEDHPIRRILASKPEISTQEPHQSAPASLPALMAANIFLIV